MAKHTYEQVMRWVAVSEGGFSNHKADPGGATNYGITQATYDAWRKAEGQSTRSVREITQTEVARIYKTNYADMIRYDALPAGVDYAVLDFAINSGVSRAVKFVQRIVGVQDDGIMGSKTLAAIGQFSPRLLIDALCDSRLEYMQSLKTWGTFGKGWERRVASVKKHARMLDDPALPNSFIPEPNKEQPAKAHGDEKLSHTINDTLKNPTAMGAVVAQAGGLLTALSGNSPIHWALASLILIGGLALIVKLVRRHD
ncbi:glycoside hydrolase family 108 protein [Cardiobacteriaceae bacterium TAE3-ERU3]|nr:glycoside hydrolase family 108 protein [Cardiobacteriaceae bacterium TAE3-ERU3]